MPGRSVEQLIEVVSFRRADAREVSLGQTPIGQQLRSGETVRAEEVVLTVPDGRSIRTLINATPIRAEGDAIGSVVATLQDLAPLDEVERLRTEFLSLVSHELRAPLTAIKGSADTLLEEGEDLDRAEMREFFRIIADQARHMRGLIGDLLDAGRIDSGTLSVAPEVSEVAVLVERARDTFVSGGGRHAVLVDLPADLPPVLADRRRIVQVLNNLLSNAARHAPESSPIRVAAAREEAHIAASVSDEGRGVAPELLPHLFRKHAGGGAGPRRATASGSPSRRASSRRTAAAYGPRAPVPAAARPSPSRCPRLARPAPPPPPRAPPASGVNRRASWPWTTTRGCCASSATRCRRPATPRSSPASRRTSRASSGPSGRGWCCSTSCCPTPTAWH